MIDDQGPHQAHYRECVLNQSPQLGLPTHSSLAPFRQKVSQRPIKALAEPGMPTNPSYGGKHSALARVDSSSPTHGVSSRTSHRMLTSQLTTDDPPGPQEAGPAVAMRLPVDTCPFSVGFSASCAVYSLHHSKLRWGTIFLSQTPFKDANQHEAPRVTCGPCLKQSTLLCPFGQDGVITPQPCDLQQVTVLLCTSVSSSVRSSSYPCLQWAAVKLSMAPGTQGGPGTTRYHCSCFRPQAQTLPKPRGGRPANRGPRPSREPPRFC